MTIKTTRMINSSILTAATAIVLAISAAPTFGQTWQVITERDSMTDAVERSARITNASGHQLVVFRAANDEVWMTFRLSDRTADTISPEHLIMYRIDKHEAHDVKDLKVVERLVDRPMLEWQPKWVHFVFWHGKENEIRGSIDHMMNGKVFLVRYFLSTGGSKETAFSLSGSGSAISRAIGIRQNQKTATDPT